MFLRMNNWLYSVNVSVVEKSHKQQYEPPSKTTNENVDVISREWLNAASTSSNKNTLSRETL